MKSEAPRSRIATAARPALIGGWLLAALSGLVVQACTSDTGVPLESKKGERHAASGVWKLRTDKELRDPDFARYVKDTRDMLQMHRWHIPGETEEARSYRVGLISPKEWPLAGECNGKARAGVLLIHGLTDTPYLMRDIGDFLQQLDRRCLLVRSILLPGHGTAPGDLLEVTNEQWKETVQYAIRSFEGVTGEVYLVGFSTGAALSLLEALKGQHRGTGVTIKALLLFSPAIALKKIASWRHVTPRVFVALGYLREKCRWFDIHEDRDYAKYESFPVNAFLQIFRLDEELYANREAVTVPVFMAVSAEDETVDAEAVYKFFRNQTPRDSRMILYSRGETPPKWIEEAPGDRLRIVNGTVADASVLEFSHTAVPVSPDNPHYGPRGQYGRDEHYTNCLHYRENGELARFCGCFPAVERERLRACDGIKTEGPFQVRYGEMTESNLSDPKMMLRRLTFNPRFSELKKEIQGFLEAVDPR